MNRTDAAKNPDAPAHHDLLRAYKAMLLARRLDETEQRLVASGEAFFHVSGAGHEALALLADNLGPQDWLHAHYRDKALLIARGTSVLHFLHGLLATAESHSAGRQMSAHISDPARRALSMVGPVGNNALQAVGVAAQVKEDSDRPVVLCALGDGTTQQGEFYEAVADAVRDQLPVLFLVEDNQFAISTPTTGRTFLACPGPFFGLDIQSVDGRRPQDCRETFARVVRQVRETRGPAILHFKVERLDSHTNADDQTVYRTAAEIRTCRETADPIRSLRAHLLTAGVGEAVLLDLEKAAAREVQEAEKTARFARDPKPEPAARIADTPEERARPEYRGTPPGEGALVMGAAMREVLRNHLAGDPRVSLFGQDIADPKGDVFGVTRGLSTQFPGRVVNAPLAESTIVGKSIGRALAGGRPVAFLQFADFLPIAFNQIATELGSMHWRTNGAWTAPVIVMISCGAYRPGLGPFHAHTFESIAAHVPGVDVVMPSSAADAAGLLNAAFASGRPTLFFYPKICLNDREQATSPDVDRHWVLPGRARHLTRGSDLTLVTWGGTLSQCRQAVAALAGAGVAADLMDLRSLTPWDKPAVLASARHTGKVVIVHEDNLTCGFGAEVAAAIAEDAPGVHIRRVARPDTYVPFHFGNQLEILPSFKRVLEVCAELTGLEVSWTPAAAAAPSADVVTVEAQGSSPADTGVTIVQWGVKPGDRIVAGQTLAELEGDKASLDFASPCSGIVDRLLAAEGERIAVGAPLVTVRLDDGDSHRRRATREESGTPVLVRKAPAPGAAPAAPRNGPVPAHIVAITVESGGKVVTNEEIVRRFPGHTAEEISTLTGIRERRHLLPNQTVITLAAEAARRALAEAGLKPSDLTAVICSTSTPASITPTTASLVLAELCKGTGPVEMPAHDVLAACSGYLYALADAHDILQSDPAARVLVISAEALSPVTNPNDFDTAILFGDAATATLVCGPEAPRVSTQSEVVRWVMEQRPVLSGLADANAALVVPMPAPTQPGYVTMNGREVFAQAVRAMIKVLGRACAAEHVRMEDLDLIVPHQANGRILDAIARRLKAPTGQVFDVIARHGNTSSSTIPLALTQIPPEGSRRIGLVAFGGGFTYGAAILRRD